MSASHCRSRLPLARSRRRGPAVELTSPQLQARQQIAALEGALENAVRQGTVMLNKRLQASNTDNMVMLAGLARARGFRLDDYGVVFDVEFPSMRRSMVWSIQELEKNTASRPGACAPAERAADGTAARDLSDGNRECPGQRHRRLQRVCGRRRERMADGRRARKRPRSALRARRPERHGDHHHSAHQRERPAGPSRRHARARGRAQARDVKHYNTG